MGKEAITEKAALKVIEQEQFEKFEKALKDAREAFNALNLAKEGMDTANADISKMFMDMSANLRLTKDFRPQYLEAFMRHNFAIAQKDPDKPEELVIAVPKIWGYSAGWWEREDEGYNYFRASRFIDLWMDLPEEVRQILQLGEKLPITLMNGFLMAPPELTAKVEQKYGKFLERKLDKGKWAIKPRSIFDIRIKLVRDGIVPFVKEPIPQEMIWEREIKFKLRPHQAEAVELFKQYNSIGVFWPGGQGKTFFGMAAMSTVKPRYLIAMRSKLLVQQWKDRIEEFTTLPSEDYDVGTYQTAIAKWKTKKYTLAIFDECFPYDSEVLLANGKREKIGVLAGRKSSEKVVSYNFKEQKWESRSIIGWHKKKPEDDILQIKTTQRFSGLTCTANHLLFSFDRNQWVQAGDLKIGEHIVCRPKGNGAYRIPTCLGKKQWQVVIGTVLGDGCIPFDQRSQRMARLVLVHSKDQLEYLNHKLHVLSSLHFSVPRFALTEFSPKKGVYKSASACSVELADRTYEEMMMLDELEPLGLAYWFMDDGSFVEKKRYAKLHVEGRSRIVAERMAEILKTKFGTECSVDISKGPIIRFTIGGTERLCSLIADYVIPSMQYKLLPSHRGKFQPWNPDPSSIAITRVESVQTVRLRNSRKRPYADNVYCIDVENNHTFVVGNILVHNCQHIPAPTFFELAYFNVLFRVGLSSSPFREDGKTDLIIGISGYPTGLKWDYFKEKDLIIFPSVDVWIVKDVNDKFKTIDDLLLDRKPTMIFCDHLEFGKAIAGRFETEFVSGETKKQLEKVRETLAEKKVVVVSRVGDEGISVPELRRTIEADFLFGSRAQEIQRVMRLFHSAEKGEHHVIMTVGEYESYRKRLFSLLSKGFDVVTHYEGIERAARLTYHEPIGVRQRSPARKKLVPMPTQQEAPIKTPVFSGMPGYEKIFASLRPAQQSLVIFLKERDGTWVKTSKIYPILGYQTYQGMMNTVNLPELEKRKLIERGTGKIRTNFQGLMT